MSTRLYDIAIAIAPAITGRTLENLRRTLEDLWVKSTAQDASDEDRAAFNSDLIARCHTVARMDNAQMIYEWARAIDLRLSETDQLGTRIEYIQGQIAKRRDQIAYYQETIRGIEEEKLYPTYSALERQREAASTARALQRTESEVESYEAELRNLRQAPVVDRSAPPHPGPAGSVAPGSVILDGSMPDLPRPGA